MTIRPEDTASSVGLSTVDARERLARDGPNLLPTGHPPAAWRRLLAEMVHFFALLFWAAGALALVAGLPQLGVAVFVVVVLNGVFAFIQQERATRAAERLRDLLPRQATVMRDGVQVDLDATDLVVDDLVVLGEGDRVSADLRLVSAHALAVDTATLTGESVPAHPGVGDVVNAGSFIVEGEGRAIVVATGRRTRLAEIAGLTSRQRPTVTPLHRELTRVSRVIAVLAVGVGASFFGVATALGTSTSDGFLFAIGVTVAVVPCGLLPTVTLSLAMGAQRMASRHALVRHLEAVETLGSTTVICTDKTGTLTRNEMAVVEVWLPAGGATIVGDGYAPTATVALAGDATIDDLRRIGSIARHCSSGHVVEGTTGWEPRGDPMEAAIDALARRAGAAPEIDAIAEPDQARFPFDARRRRMSVATAGHIMVKGAPDAVLPRCNLGPDRLAAEAAVADLASKGLRVLAVAQRSIDGITPAIADEAERDLTVVGLLGFEDPPRTGAADAIAACRRAGIAVAMITGDHPHTALAVAREVGLIPADAAPTILVGDDLPSDDEALAAHVDVDGAVIARVTPQQKLRIAAALRARGHVVAMTGDGVNDAPALREAAIGVAMGRSGTDVAREAADLVLLDDDFATIVAAIEQGRATYANIRRFLTYHLTDNVAELTPFLVWALSGGRIPLAIGVLQVLALDIGTDVLPALALGAEPPGAHVLDRPPTRRHLLDRHVFTRAFGLLGPIEATVAMLAFLATYWNAGWRAGDPFSAVDALTVASGAAFTAVVFGQVANAFACRSTVIPAWRLPLRRNRLLLWAVVAELVMLVSFLCIGPLAELLGQAPPSAMGFIVAITAIPAVLFADAAQKALARRRHNLH